MEITAAAVKKYEDARGRKLTDSELRAVIRAEVEFYGAVRRDDEGNPYHAAGKYFERKLTEMIIEDIGFTEEPSKPGSLFRPARIRNESVREANIVEDVLESTDVVIHGLPIDITINPDKNGEIGSVSVDEDSGEASITSGFTEIGEINGVKVSFGFRTTNGVHKLDMPVCVILFSDNRELRASPESLLENVGRDRKKLQELIDDAMSSYWDYADAA
jgi:hypothetical protein